MMHDTMRHGSQKIRDADTRARHVSSWINEGCVHPAPPSSPSSCLPLAREICCESVGTLTREDQPGAASSSVSSRSPHRVNIRLGDPVWIVLLRIVCRRRVPPFAEPVISLSFGEIPNVIAFSAVSNVVR